MCQPLFLMVQYRLCYEVLVTAEKLSNHFPMTAPGGTDPLETSFLA